MHYKRFDCIFLIRKNILTLCFFFLKKSNSRYIHLFPNLKRSSSNLRKSVMCLQENHINYKTVKKIIFLRWKFKSVFDNKNEIVKNNEIIDFDHGTIYRHHIWKKERKKEKDLTVFWSDLNLNLNILNNKCIRLKLSESLFKKKKAEVTKLANFKVDWLVLTGFKAISSYFISRVSRILLKNVIMYTFVLFLRIF